MLNDIFLDLVVATRRNRFTGSSMAIIGVFKIDYKEIKKTTIRVDVKYSKVVSIFC